MPMYNRISMTEKILSNSENHIIYIVRPGGAGMSLWSIIFPWGGRAGGGEWSTQTGVVLSVGESGNAIKSQ